MPDFIHKAFGLEEEFFIGRNQDAQRRDISWEARGLLFELISRPSNWKIIMSEFEGESAGRDKIRRMFKELVKFGYVAVEQGRSADGKFDEQHLHVYAIPERNPHFQPLTEKPSTAEPLTGEPLTANPQLQSKELDKEKKEESIPLIPSGESPERKKVSGVLGRVTNNSEDEDEEENPKKKKLGWPKRKVKSFEEEEAERESNFDYSPKRTIGQRHSIKADKPVLPFRRTPEIMPVSQLETELVFILKEFGNNSMITNLAKEQRELLTTPLHPHGRSIENVYESDPANFVRWIALHVETACKGKTWSYGGAKLVTWIAETMPIFLRQNVQPEQPQAVSKNVPNIGEQQFIMPANPSKK